MKGPDISSFRKWTTLAVLALLVLHIVIALILTFGSPIGFTGKSKISRIYQHLIHLGPFYRAESIRSSPHLVLSHKGKTIDVVKLHHDRYLKNPLSTNELLLRDYARRVGDALARNPRSKNALQKLASLSRNELRDLVHGDSLTVVYLHRWYEPTSKSWTADSVVNITYFWNEENQPE